MFVFLFYDGSAHWQRKLRYDQVHGKSTQSLHCDMVKTTRLARVLINELEIGDHAGWSGESMGVARMIMRSARKGRSMMCARSHCTSSKRFAVSGTGQSDGRSGRK